MIFRRSAKQAVKPRFAYDTSPVHATYRGVLRYRNMQPHVTRPMAIKRLQPLSGLNRWSHNAHRCSAISGCNRCILSPIWFLSGRPTAMHAVDAMGENLHHLNLDLKVLDLLLFGRDQGLRFWPRSGRDQGLEELLRQLIFILAAAGVLFKYSSGLLGVVFWVRAP